MKTWEAAVAVLRETKNTAVMTGDDGLLYMIAQRAGLKCTTNNMRYHILHVEAAVLNNLAKLPGELVARYTLTSRGRTARIFFLPECVPEKLRR